MNQGKRVAPLRSSRKNTRNRVRNFVNRSPYDQDMASQSFTKIRKRKQIQISENQGRREKSRPDQVDQGVDLGVDMGGTRSTGDWTPGSTWGSTCLVGPRQLGAPVLLFGSVLEACDDF